MLRLDFGVIFCYFSSSTREIVEEFCKILEKENLTLDDSVGVGDTESAIAFLEMVKTPICFNSNRRLYEHAKSAGWKIVVERKDNIYYL